VAERTALHSIDHRVGWKDASGYFDDRQRNKSPHIVPNSRQSVLSARLPPPGLRSEVCLWWGRVAVANQSVTAAGRTQGRSLPKNFWNSKESGLNAC
jgi:hypothetical protein